MNLQEAQIRLRQIIKFNLTHADYSKTIKLRKFYLQAITGEDIDDLLPQFERRENKELWNQRKKITIENLSPVLSPVLNKFYKVARLPVNQRLEGDLTDAQKKIIADFEDSFYENSNVKDYLTNYIDDYAQVDPNAFIVMDFMPFDPSGKKNLPKRPVPFPVIFDCDQVLDFKHDTKGNLDYLVVFVESTVRDPSAENKAEEKVKDYWIFLAGYSIRFFNVHKWRQTPEGSGATETINGKTYKVIVNKTSSPKVAPKVQAKRIGYIRHKKYRNICVSPFYKATPILKDLIRHKSNYDLSMILHVFPKLFQYGDVCEGEKEKGKGCQGGYVTGTNKTEVCGACNGTGFQLQRSAQEYIILKRPKDGQTAIPLKDMAYYLSPDINVIEKLKTELTDLQEKVFISVFSTTLAGTTSGAKTVNVSTATYTNEKKEDINDALLPYAQQRSNLYIFMLEFIGAFNDIPVTPVFEYPKRLEVESIIELMDRLKAYTDAGVSELLIDEVETQIAVQQLENDPSKLLRYTVQNRFRPFRGKSSSAKASLLSSQYVPEDIKTLYANLSYIFDKIEAAYEKNLSVFYEKSYDDQWSEIKKIIDEIKVMTKVENQAAIPLVPRKATV